MKYVLLAIFVFIASLPIEASICDMHESQGMAHNQHGDMMDDIQMEMDCCDHEGSNSSERCDPVKHCGASASSVVAINITAISVAFVTNHEYASAESSGALSRYNPPPLRPPIT